jgi:uncharacterized repeat protein (TIGR02543 family)
LQQIQIQQGSSIKFPDTPVRTGYEFRGWFTEPDGAGREITFNNTPLSDMTVYACWEISFYFLTYYANMQELRWQDELDDYPYPYSYRVAHGSSIPLPEPFKLSHYQFLGWNTEKDGSGQTIGENTVVRSQMELYAQWKPKCYTITFYDWNGTFFGQKVDEYGKLIEYPIRPERPGYRFIGWVDVILVLSDCSVTAAYDIIPITPKTESSIKKDYERSILSNIPYGTTKQVLLNNLVNPTSLIRVTLNDETPITNPDAILHTGNRVQLVVDGFVYDNYFLLIEGDPNPERPVGSGPGYYPGSNQTDQPASTTKSAMSTGTAETSQANVTTTTTAETTKVTSVTETSPTTASCSIETSNSSSNPTITSGITTAPEPSVNDSMTETTMTSAAFSQASLPGGPVNTATLLIILGSIVGSLGLIGMVAVTQHRHREAQPDENDPDKEENL